MRELLLTKGYVALVDDEDYDYVNQWKWHFTSYMGACRNVPLPHPTSRNHRQTTISLHRTIMNTPKDMVCDHINGNRLDNRKSNLRNCSQSENMKNRKINVNNTSGYKGVLWESRKKYWYATIQSNRKRVYLGGGFQSPKDAALLYDKHAKLLHGEFAKLNFPETKEIA